MGPGSKSNQKIVISDNNITIAMDADWANNCQGLLCRSRAGN